MKTQIRSLIIVAVLANVPACSTIKNLFPDKEKDYQFTTEIPPLVMPPDLAGDIRAKVPAAPVVEAADVAAAPATETAPTVDRKLIQVELINAGEEARRLRIGAPSVIAWRMVGKALSRKSVEVTNRNQEQGLFRVQYDPNKQEVEDGSIWDEVVFLFKGFDVTEQEYVVKLVENDQQTDVVILDKEQKPVSDETSLSLLTLLHNTIKADLAK